MENNRVKKFNEEVEQLRENNCYAAVGNRLKEVDTEKYKDKDYFRIKNWYF